MVCWETARKKVLVAPETSSCTTGTKSTLSSCCGTAVSTTEIASFDVLPKGLGADICKKTHQLAWPALQSQLHHFVETDQTQHGAQKRIDR
mmetsp:Transcript_71277/g.155330  ORF Transcript_71277/g.155330 Transcript_71277/m.155330 type:complete len:91 (-) Transcript_71277:149-421(-)